MTRSASAKASRDRVSSTSSSVPECTAVTRPGVSSSRAITAANSSGSAGKAAPQPGSAAQASKSSSSALWASRAWNRGFLKAIGATPFSTAVRTRSGWRRMNTSAARVP